MNKRVESGRFIEHNVKNSFASTVFSPQKSLLALQMAQPVMETEGGSSATPTGKGKEPVVVQSLQCADHCGQ